MDNFHPKISRYTKPRKLHDLSQGFSATTRLFYSRIGYTMPAMIRCLDQSLVWQTIPDSLDLHDRGIQLELYTVLTE